MDYLVMRKRRQNNYVGKVINDWKIIAEIETDKPIDTPQRKHSNRKFRVENTRNGDCLEMYMSEIKQNNMKKLSQRKGFVNRVGQVINGWEILYLVNDYYVKQGQNKLGSIWRARHQETLEEMDAPYRVFIDRKTGRSDTTKRGSPVRHGIKQKDSEMNEEFEYLYRMWQAIKRKCECKKDVNYKNWGALGYTYDEERYEKSVTNFIHDVMNDCGHRPSKRFTLLPKHGKQYTKNNFKWVKRKRMKHTQAQINNKNV